VSKTIDSKHIIKIHDKEHVTYEGLLSMATDNGLESLEVDIRQFPSQENGNTCVCIATAKCQGRTFTDIGDANPDNVNSMISKHIIRMASTRAKARALRDMLNIGMCAVEELDADASPQNNNSPAPQKPASVPGTNKPATDKQKQYFRKLGKEKGLSEGDLKLIVEKTIGKVDTMTIDQMSKCIEVVRNWGA
jgi:hypothetical protein